VSCDLLSARKKMASISQLCLLTTTSTTHDAPTHWRRDQGFIFKACSLHRAFFEQLNCPHRWRTTDGLPSARKSGKILPQCTMAPWNTLSANKWLLGVLHAPSHCKSSDRNSPRQPPVGWHPDGQIHKDRKVQAQLDLPGCDRTPCEI